MLLFLEIPVGVRKRLDLSTQVSFGKLMKQRKNIDFQNEI
jgi:hypothetical protein